MPGDRGEFARDAAPPAFAGGAPTEPLAVAIGASAPRLPNTTCLAFPGLRADTQLIALDIAGIAVSAGAACSSGKLGPSHVLAAMGLGELSGQAIRVSLPWNVTADAIPAFRHAYEAMIKQRLRAQPGCA